MSRQHSSLMIMSEAFGVLHHCTLGFSASLELSFPSLPLLFFFLFSPVIRIRGAGWLRDQRPWDSFHNKSVKLSFVVYFWDILKIGPA